MRCVVLCGVAVFFFLLKVGCDWLSLWLRLLASSSAPSLTPAKTTHETHPTHHTHDRLVKTTDFLSTPGSVMLVHASAAQVAADYDQIHAWSAEPGLFYEVEGGLASGPTGSGV